MYNFDPPSTSAAADAAFDRVPLLSNYVAHNLIRSHRHIRRSPPHLRAAARFLRRASARRMTLREQSMRVRENAAEQLEDRQSDWAYSKPVTVLDILWNLAFCGIGCAVLWLSLKEKSAVPLRLWAIGYILRCIFHVVCVVVHYRQWRQARMEQNVGWESDESSSAESVSDGDDFDMQQIEDDETDSVAKHLESANNVFSFIWWILGFYWVTSGSQDLTQDAPQLYWLCITFLACDVVIILVCVAVAFLVGIAICCFLPCIIAILYLVTDQQGATKEEIEKLPKFKFCRLNEFEKVNGAIQESSRGLMTECNTDASVFFCRKTLNVASAFVYMTMEMS